MLDPLPPDQWGLYAAAIATLAGAIVALLKGSAEAAKTRAEVASMRADMARSAQRTTEILHQVTPNDGGSLMDSSTRAEEALTTLTADIRRLDGNMRDIAADIRGARRDIGRLADADQLLAATDLRDREAADHVHALIHQRIDDLAVPCSPGGTDAALGAARLGDRRKDGLAGESWC